MSDETARERILELTTMFIAGMVERGELDPDDDAALRAAARKAAADARSAYYAALEFISG